MIVVMPADPVMLSANRAPAAAARTRRLLRSLPLLGLLLFFWLALDTALIKSPTVDESVHLLRGVILWQTGDLTLQTQPPLSHWLIGSLVMTEPDLPEVTGLPSWTSQDRPRISDELVWQSGLRVERLFALARFPIVLTALLLGAMLVRWAGESSGPTAGAIAALSFAFSPNLLAFASLATTDLVVGATYLAVVFCWWRYWRRPAGRRWLWAGLALGLALGAKLTALLLLPVTLALGFAGRRRHQSRWQPWLAWISLLPLAGLTLWALYGFELRPTAGLAWPLPAATYLDNFLKVQEHVSQGHGAFLMGQLSRDGWWHYFVVALLIKTPLPTLLLAGAAAFSLWRPGWLRRDAFLWLPAGALFVVASATRLNIGYRHILPVLPFLLVWGAAAAASAARHPAGRLLVTLLLLWLGLGTLHQHPDHLASMNELVGGSANGYRYLGDSNLDWGQDLGPLAQRLKESGREDVYLSYFGSADPGYYGLDLPPLFDQDGIPLGFNPANPAPGLYAISASHLQGMVLAEPDLLDWFRHKQPQSQVGFSILLYQVSSADAGSWIAHCNQPGPLLEPAAAEALVGAEQVRHLYFDCEQSWVFPDAAQDGAPGWYILPPGPGQREGEWPIQALIADGLILRYVHAASALDPAYRVYYWPGGEKLLPALTKTAGRVEQENARPVSLPVTVGRVADLIGFGTHLEDWWTVWQVRAATRQPLSVSAHLYTGDPEPLVADGLGVPAEQWAPGDLVVQYHHFEKAGRYLETGLYDYLSGDRLLLTGPDLSGDRLFLHP